VQGRRDGNVIVVRKMEDCPADRKVVSRRPGGPVAVFDAVARAFPVGFAGIWATRAGGAAVAPRRAAVS
jgi:hypothetical protein